MNSVKCSACGFVGWSGVEVCKKCGATLMPHSAPSPGQSHDFVPNQPDGRRPDAQLKNGLAICSLVIGILNLFTLGMLGLGAILGITLAIVALSKIKSNPRVYGGKGFATAGLVTSILSVVIIVPIGIIAAIAIPNLIAARTAANEGSTITALRGISAAEAIYASTHDANYGTLEELANEALITRGVAAGTRNGYLIKIAVSNSTSLEVGGFKLVAVPLTYPTSGRRSFFIDETGVIRGRDAHGTEATEFDNPLNIDSSDPSREPAARNSDRNTED